MVEVWGLLRQGVTLLVDARGKGKATMVQHLLRNALVGCLDTEVAKHGFRAPPTKEADAVDIHACAQEGGCSAGANSASSAELGWDSGGLFEEASGVL